MHYEHEPGRGIVSTALSLANWVRIHVRSTLTDSYCVSMWEPLLLEITNFWMKDYVQEPLVLAAMQLSLCREMAKAPSFSSMSCLWLTFPGGCRELSSCQSPPGYCGWFQPSFWLTKVKSAEPKGAICGWSSTFGQVFPCCQKIMSPHWS